MTFSLRTNSLYSVSITLYLELFSTVSCLECFDSELFLFCTGESSREEVVEQAVKKSESKKNKLRKMSLLVNRIKELEHSKRKRFQLSITNTAYY